MKTAAVIVMYATACAASTMPPIKEKSEISVICDGTSIIDTCGGHGNCKASHYDDEGDLVYTCSCKNDYATLKYGNPCEYNRKNQGLMFGLSWLPVPGMVAFMMGWTALGAAEIAMMCIIVFLGCCLPCFLTGCAFICCDAKDEAPKIDHSWVPKQQDLEIGRKQQAKEELAEECVAVCTPCIAAGAVIVWVILHFVTMGFVGTDCVDGNGIRCVENL